VHGRNFKFENLKNTNQIVLFIVRAQKVKKYHIPVPRDPTQNINTTLSIG
jgi:hypothetical protein